jgi:uncharacterized protein (TIGR03663 family)
VLFTTFFTDPDHWDGLWEGLDYWLGQHGVGRGGEAWFFYGVLLLGVEWPVLLLAAIGAMAALARPSPFRVFCVWMFVVSFAVYSWAGEKFAWLVLHSLLPLIVLAGIGAQVLWGARRTWRGRALLAGAAIGAGYLAVASFSVNALYRADPRELLVSTQSSEAVVEVRDTVRATARRVESELGRPAVVVIDASEGATFPWAWYFRDGPRADYVDLSTAAEAPAADVLLLTDAARRRLAGGLGAYRALRFPFRVWWVRDYGRATPGAWTRWLLEREPWSPTGGMPAWLLIRSDLEGP